MHQGKLGVGYVGILCIIFSVNLHYSKTKSLFLKTQENIYKAYIS